MNAPHQRPTPSRSGSYRPARCPLAPTLRLSWDFLFEAIEPWDARRNDDVRLPNHNVVLPVIAGASTGGINCAIASTACTYSFPPVILADERGGALSEFLPVPAPEWLGGT